MTTQPWRTPPIYGGVPVDPTTGMPVDPTMGMRLPPPQQPGLLSRMSGALGGSQGLLNLGANLLSASGPSPQPVSLGSAVGNALIANQQFQRQNRSDMLEEMLLKTKLQKKPKIQEEYEYAKSQGFTGSLDEWRRVSSAQQADPAAVREWQVYSKLPPDDQKRYLEMKRALQIETVNQVPTVVRGQGLDPLSTLGSEASAAATMAGAEAKAKAIATGEVERDFTSQKKSEDLQQTIKLYESARDGLVKGLEGTSTGPIAGRIPAVTAGQQIAEGGVAAMAPVLKQLFRVSGEGVFTDRDQQLLLDMVPKRTDHPEARKAKMENIDTIVKAKLSMPGGSQSTATKRIRVDAQGNVIQ